MKHIFSFLACCMILMASACQPTPEAEPIIDRTDAYENIQPITVEEPQNVIGNGQTALRIDEEYTTARGVPVTIHGNVTAPSETSIPIVRVQTCRFSRDQILKWISVLGDGASLCEQPKDSFSREYYAECIRREQEALETETDLSKVEGHKGSLQFYIEAYDSAKPENEIDRDRPFDVANLDTKKNFTIVLRKDGKTVGTVAVTEASADGIPRCVFEYVPGVARREYTGDVDISHPDAAYISFSESDAIHEAAAFLERLGISHMEHAYSEIMYRYQGTSIDSRPSAYRLFFTRTVNGMPKPFYWIRAWEIGHGGSGQQAYKPTWTPEYIDIIVDAEGVADFRWQDPVEVVEVVNENVQAISFDEAHKAFDAYIDILRSAGQYIGGDPTIEITDILFGYDFFPVRDSLITFDMVPCWFFMGYDEESKLFHTRGAQLILNAVDGKLPVS